MRFTTHAKVRFADVDAAGIVFYPRYFEMLNAAVEDWCADGLGWDFRRMHLELRIGIPTVRLECDFVKPSHLGDLLAIHLMPTRLGNRSLGAEFQITGTDQAGGEQTRIQGRAVLVCMALDTQTSIDWPPELRAKIEQFLPPSSSKPPSPSKG